MCGQVGMLIGMSERSQEELDDLKYIFTEMLRASEDRGPFATGMAYVKNDGEHRISKLVIPARDFVRGELFAETMAEVDNTVTVLMGHTRWPTRGNIEDVANAQPKRAGQVVGTHNGTVTNADDMFWKFRLPRFSEVDSEVVFQLAESVADEDGINMRVLASRLGLCHGSIASVMVSKSDPERVLFVKGPNPLEFAYSKKLNVLCYGSKLQYIQAAVGAGGDWRRKDIPSDSLVAISTRTMKMAGAVPIEWPKMRTRSSAGSWAAVR